MDFVNRLVSYCLPYTAKAASKAAETLGSLVEISTGFSVHEPAAARQRLCGCHTATGPVRRPPEGITLNVDADLREDRDRWREQATRALLRGFAAVSCRHGGVCDVALLGTDDRSVGP